MNSDYKQLQPSEEMVARNSAFLEKVKNDYISILVEEFEHLISGFSSMSYLQRLAFVLKLNEPLQGIGDFLSLGDSVVFAGVHLGEEREYMIHGITFKQVRPRFYGDADGFRNFVGDYLIIGETEYFLTFERDKYDALPAPYKAALLCRYIKMRVLFPGENDSAVISFVLGTSDTLEIQRYSVRPLTSEGSFRGWDIKIADYPDAKYWSKLRDVVCNGGHVPDSKAKRTRKPDPKTEFVCGYIHDLEQNGVVIDARRGGIGYEKIMVDLELNYPDMVRHYEPDTLGRLYRAYKKRLESKGR